MASKSQRRTTSKIYSELSGSERTEKKQSDNFRNLITFFAKLLAVRPLPSAQTLLGLRLLKSLRFSFFLYFVPPDTEILNLHWMRNPGQTISVTRRWRRPSGLVCLSVTMWQTASKNISKANIRRYSHGTNMHRHTNTYTQTKMMSLFTNTPNQHT